MLIDRRQPLATTLPLTWKFLGILVGVIVVAAMACVAGVPRATAEGDSPAAAERPDLEITDEPVIPGQASGGGEMSDASSAQTEARQLVDEAIRAALKDVPGAMIQTVHDPKTGRVSVTVGVPAEHFERVWRMQQEKDRRGSRSKTDMPSGMTKGMDTGDMGMGGIGMGGMRMGDQFESIFREMSPDQFKNEHIEEINNIRDTVTALLRKTEPDADPNASVDVSVVRDIRLDPCLVTLIDEVAIPAQTEGPVVELAVREGDRVERGQMLARIDDRRAMLKVDEAPGKDLDVKYAEAVAEEADADFESVLESNRRAPGTVSKTELRRHALELALTKIRVEQAQRAMAGTRAQEAQLALAETELRNYRTEAPADGIVVKIFPHVGEWVRSGDPICHIVRMERLRVEARLDVNRYSPDEVRGSDVIIEVRSVRGKVGRMPGKVTFVSPLLEDDSRCKVVAEVSNRVRDGQYLLRPGMQVTMVIKLASRPGSR